MLNFISAMFGAAICICVFQWTDSWAKAGITMLMLVAVIGFYTWHLAQKYDLK